MERENVRFPADVLEWGEREDRFGAQQGRSAESWACLGPQTLDLGLPLRCHGLVTTQALACKNLLCQTWFLVRVVGQARREV